MEHTNDPSKVFEQYAEGVTVHDDKTITISPKVQRDILDCTAMLMHEHRKIMVILGVVVGMLENTEQEPELVLGHVRDMLTTYFENPEGVALHEASSPDEVESIINQIRLLNNDDEVEN